LDDPTAHQAAPTGLRVIKTHAERPFVPYSAEATYLVVVRNPADVLVSALSFWNGLVPPFARVSPEAWYRLFLEDRTPFGSWAEHVASFAPWRGRATMMRRGETGAAGEYTAEQQAVVRRTARVRLLGFGAEGSFAEAFGAERVSEAA
jgi:hypothetical protein